MLGMNSYLNDVRVDTEKQVVVYCGSGVTACNNILAMEAVGLRDVVLYPGVIYGEGENVISNAISQEYLTKFGITCTTGNRFAPIAAANTNSSGTSAGSFT